MWRRLLFLLCLVLLPKIWAACGVINGSYPIYAGTSLSFDKDSSVYNGSTTKSITQATYSTNDALNPDTGGVITPAITYPTLSPSSFPSFTGTTDLTKSSGSVSAGTYDDITISDNASVSFGAGTYYIDNLIVGKDATVTFNTGTYYIRSFTTDKNFRLATASSAVATFYINTTVNVGKDAYIVPTPNYNNNLVFYLYSGASFVVDKNLTFVGVVYGVGSSSISIGKDANYWGMAAAGSVSFDKNAFIGYDSATESQVGSVNTCGSGTPSLASFSINTGGASANTCAAKSITFTAQDSTASTVTGYTGTMTLSTSVGRGDWALVTGSGTLTNGTANDGAATYTFVAGDSGVVTLSLTDHTADDLTITAVDSTVSGSSSTSSTINFRDNALVIDANEAAAYTAGNGQYVAIAGRPHKMKAELWRKDPSTGNCSLATNYGGSTTMRFWYTADAAQPAGATAPAVAASVGSSGSLACVSATTLTTSAPTSTTATLSFASGSATFYLCPSDVGKYTLTAQVNPTSQIFSGTATLANASSNSITVRPFGIGISNINIGGTANPKGSKASDTVFAAAGSSFSATLTAFAFSTTDANNNGVADVDTDNNGWPDTGLTSTQLGATTALSRFAGSVTLAPKINTPSTGGTLGTLANATVALSSGTATVSNLSYSEVGSFVFKGVADSYTAMSSYLGSTIDLRPSSFDASGNQSPVVGRFKPYYFTASNNLSPACSSPATATDYFSYMGQTMVSGSFTVTARNASGTVTSNYHNYSYAATDADDNFARATGNSNNGIALQAENGNDGVSLASRISGLAGSWTNGVWTSTGSLVFSKPSTSTADGTWGPYDSLELGVKVNDPDANSTNAVSSDAGRPKLAGRNMDDSGTSCTSDSSASSSDGSCSAARLTGAAFKMRYGRAYLGATLASVQEVMRIPSEIQYYNSSLGWTRNTLDGCTALPAPSAGTITYCAGSGSSLSGTTSVASMNATASSGGLSLRMSRPGKGNVGQVSAQLDLSGHSWLQFAWPAANRCDAAAFTSNYPRSTSRFLNTRSGNLNNGVGSSIIHRNEVY